MKNLQIRNGDACHDLDLLCTMFVDKEKEHTVTVDEYKNQVSNTTFAPLYFHTGDGGGILVRSMAILDVLHRVSSKINGVRLTARKNHLSVVDKNTNHVYVHLNDEPFYRAVLYFGYDTVTICSHHLNTSDLSRRMRASPVSHAPGSSTWNSVDRSMSLKNVLSDVCGIIREVCAATPVSVSDFEEVCLKGQKGRVEQLTEGNSAVTKAIEALIGKGYSYGKESLDNELRVAAFLALESVVRGTKPVFSVYIADRFKNFLPQIDSAREDAAVTIGKVPVQIIKIKGHDAFVAKLGDRVVRWKQLPDAVMAPVATVMSIGNGGTVAGVGGMVSHLPSTPLELDIVVMVDAEENL
jgi:hypothetical protein